MCKLTVGLVEGSANVVVAGDELTDMIPDEHRRKGTLEFVRLGASFLDSFYQDDL
jgi:hypothetical protein